METPAPDQAQVIELASAVSPPADGILTRAIYQDSKLKAVIFGFSPGQELSEHTAATPAIMHFLSGEADITVGVKQSSAMAGTWVHMPAGLPHSVVAKTPVVMLLLLLK